MVRRKGVVRPHGTPRTTSSEKSDTHVIVQRSKRKSKYMRALKEIKYLRQSIKLLIPKAPFARLVREIIMDFFPREHIDRIQSTALEALQEATEAYMTQFFEDCVLLSMHAKRKTLMRQDMILMRRLRGRDDVINR